jgi:uncharacterized sulfatase
MTLKFNSFLPFLVISSLLLVGCNPKKSTAEEKLALKPNIIFYLADDQDIYDYGCYGNEKVNTSGVDRLAKEGLLFTNAFTAQAICAPSRSQLFTGKYPLKNACFANHTATRPTIKSVTTHLKNLGYDVILAGKSHVKPASVYQWDKEWHPVSTADGPRPYIPLDSIENYMKTAKKPFCMFITSAYPHAKYFDVENPDADDIKFLPFNEGKKEDSDYIKKKAGYYRSIAEDNTQLEKVLGYVDTYLGDNTLFIYSADHGVSGKFTVKDIGLKVPFVARWPKVIKAGTSSNQLIHYTDVLPTFIEIAGGDVPEDMDGNSLVPLLQGQDIQINDYVYGVRTNQNILFSEVFPSRMIRNDRYKYIRNFNSVEVVQNNLTGQANIDFFIERGAQAHKNEPFEELYDVLNDPFEKKNLIDNAELQSIKEKLKNDLFDWMKAQGDFLDESVGNMPLLLAKSGKGFRLDEDTPRRQIPDSIKNTLTVEDHKVVSHW